MTEPGMRRRIEIASRILPSGGGEARAALEDDFHHFRVSIGHRGGVVTRTGSESLRNPYTTCPAAGERLDELIGMPLSPASGAVFRRTDARLQCTHMLDLAGLAIAAAARGPGRRRYEIEVPDRTDGRTSPRLKRDGAPAMAWDVDGDVIGGPAPFAGVPLGAGFAKWVLENADADEAEAALVLRRCVAISIGRTKNLDAQTTAEPWGRCFSQQAGSRADGAAGARLDLGFHRPRRGALRRRPGLDRVRDIEFHSVSDRRPPKPRDASSPSPSRSCPMRTVFREDHEIFRSQVRRFVDREIVPRHAQWEHDGIVPKEVWRKAGAEGLLCVTIPEEYGGPGGDVGHAAVLIEELARANATAVGFATHSDIAAPYLLAYGSEDQKRRWLPPMARGELICAIAMTEPGIGSDLRSLRTSARPDGDDYIVNGQKTFISNGINAGLVIAATKVDPTPSGKELTLICIEEGAPGFSKGRRLEKIGLKGQDTSELFFSDVRVPAANRLGDEHKGFGYLTHQLAKERLIIAIRAAQSIETLLEETIAYTRDRKAFNQTVFDYQNSRFKLADAKAEFTMLRVFVDNCLELLMKGELTADVAAMAKLVGSEMQNRLLDDFLQLHGGYGFMSEFKVSRAWVDARVARIYGGTSEIMKEIIARTL